MRWVSVRSVLRAVLPLLALSSATYSRAAAQEPSNPQLVRAVESYRVGDLVRAAAALDSVPADVSRSDRALTSLYRGLVAFSRDDRPAARASFARALDELPSLRLDATVHSPSRVAVFDQVRDQRITEWRREASVAESEGDRSEALARWSAILGANPGDDQARAAIGRLAGQSAVPARLEAPAPERTEPETEADSPAAEDESAERSATTAALLGVALPGAGEFYAGRPARGAVVLGGVAGALAAGFLITRLEVDCRSVPQDGVCPPEDVLGETEVRPYQTAGIAAAVAIAIAGAIDAALGVQNRSGTNGLSSRIERAADGGVDVTLLRLGR